MNFSCPMFHLPNGDPMTSNFEDLILAFELFRDERDWKQFHTPKNLALAICGEAGKLTAELLSLSRPGSANRCLRQAR